MTTFQNSSSYKDIDVIKKIYSGINRNDIDSVLDLLDSNIVRVEFEGFPTAGIYRGRTDVRRHLANGRSTWAEGSCEPIECFANGNKVIVVVRVKVRLKKDSKWVDAHIADGFTLIDGRVTEFHSFATKQKAFDWAGLSA